MHTHSHPGGGTSVEGWWHIGTIHEGWPFPWEGTGISLGGVDFGPYLVDGQGAGIHGGGEAKVSLLAKPLELQNYFALFKGSEVTKRKIKVVSSWARPVDSINAFLNILDWRMKHDSDCHFGLITFFKLKQIPCDHGEFSFSYQLPSRRCPKQ